MTMSLMPHHSHHRVFLSFECLQGIVTWLRQPVDPTGHGSILTLSGALDFRASEITRIGGVFLGFALTSL